MSAFEILTPEFGLRVSVDLCAMSTLLFGLYYRRYRDKELVTAAALFNIFVFAVLAMLTEAHISVKTGFGLFAILALFTLRSEQLSKLEIAYFFGSISIAVICSVQGALPLMAAMVCLVVLGTWVLDHPRILRAVGSTKVTLDRIEQDTLSDTPAMCARLSKLLGVEVLSYQITAMDYINDTARANVYFRKR
jgi:hypothetical protein